MRRHYTLSSFMKIPEELKKRYPMFNFTTDVIVGFPGETEEDFRATCKSVTEAGFSHIHTFKYSVRSGTAASGMDDQVHEKVKNERSRIIREISDTNKINYRKKLLGRKQTMLVEKIDRDGDAKGYGENYIPLYFRPQIKEKNYFTRVMLKEINMEIKDLPVRVQQI